MYEQVRLGQFFAASLVLSIYVKEIKVCSNGMFIVIQLCKAFFFLLLTLLYTHGQSDFSVWMPQSVQRLRLASVLIHAKEPFHSLFMSSSFPTKMFILCHSFVFQYIKSPQSAYLSALYDGNTQATWGQTQNTTRNKDLKTWVESQRKEHDIHK